MLSRFECMYKKVVNIANRWLIKCFPADFLKLAKLDNCTSDGCKGVG